MALFFWDIHQKQDPWHVYMPQPSSTGTEFLPVSGIEAWCDEGQNFISTLMSNHQLNLS